MASASPATLADPSEDMSNRPFTLDGLIRLLVGASGGKPLSNMLHPVDARFQASSPHRANRDAFVSRHSFCTRARTPTTSTKITEAKMQIRKLIIHTLCLSPIRVHLRIQLFSGKPRASCDFLHSFRSFLLTQNLGTAYVRFRLFSSSRSWR